MEELIKKIGLDKLAHLGWGGWIAAMITLVLLLQDMPGVSWHTLLWTVAGVVVATVMGLVKEIADSKLDLRDLAWTVGGSISIFIVAFVGILLNKAQFGW